MTMGGTPDRYFDLNMGGSSRDLWVEFKYANPTANGVDVGGLLSPLQKKWLRRRWQNSGNACVMVGVRNARAEGFVLESPELWEARVTREFVLHNKKSAHDLAIYIAQRLL